MSEIQFELDGIIVESPKGWQEATLVWEFDEEFRLWSQVLEGDFNFHSDGFTYLDLQFNTAGFCDTVNVIVKYKCDGETDFSIIHTGLIFISDCAFNLQKCTVSTSISDDSWHGKIKNSQNMKFFLNAGFSKDGSAVTVNKSTVRFHNIATGAHDPVNTKVCYRVEDAFRYTIDAMTNNEVDFISDFFGSGGLCNGLMLTTGQEIRLDDDLTAPEVSFKDLFEAVNKKLNIGAAIEDIAGVPTLRIEPWSYFFQENQQKLLENVPDVLRVIEEDKLYSTVRLGASSNLEFDNVTPNTSFPKVRWIGWIDSTYHTIDDCNIDNELNLENNDYIIDSNNIENQLNGNDDEDDSIFMVATFDIGAVFLTDAENFISIVPAAFFYNQKLNNDSTAGNWFGAVPSSIAKYLGDGNDEFSADLGVAISFTLFAGTTRLFPTTTFDNETSDPNNNYDPVLGEYTAPVDGAYIMRTTNNIQVTFNGASAGDLRVETRYFVNTFAVGAALGTFVTNTGPHPQVIDISIPHERGIFANSGDIITVEVTFISAGAGPDDTDIIYKSSSSFACINAITGGGIFQTYDGDQVKIINFEFDYPLSLTEFKSMTSTTELTNGIPNYRNFIDIEVGEGWIKRLAYPLVGGRSSFVLRTQTDPIITSTDVAS